MPTQNLERRRIEHLEKIVAVLKKQVSFLMPSENLSQYKNAGKIKRDFKEALKLYSMQ